jgi:signal transduction histidine kinase
LLSLVLTTAILTFAMLLAVRYSVQKHAQHEVVAEARSSLLTFDALLGEHQKALARKADLLATRASMSGDDMDVTPSSGDALESDGSDLIAIADASNNIVVQHSRNARVPLANAREILARARAKGFTSDWWYVGGALYQVSIQRIGHGGSTMIVGREIDYRAVRDMGRISASQVVFSYQQTVVASTFRAFDEQEAGKKIRELSSRGKIELGDDQFFADTLELNSDPGHIVRVTALKSYREATAFLTTLNHLLVSLGFLAVLAGAALMFFISGRFTRPLADLLNGFEALEGGDYAFPLHAQGGDEVACAIRAFDRMREALQKNEVQRQELEEQLRQSQKMEALGRLAGGVAHDFNNLLTVIKGHCELILDRNTGGAVISASGQQIRKAADRAAALTRQMLAFSRKQALQPKVLDVNAIVEDVGRFLQRLLPEDVEVVFRTNEALGRVKADASQLEQVLLNLTVNARDAMPQGGILTVETGNVTVDEELARTHPSVQPGDYVKLSVSDTGTGMDAETKAHIFEPFFTTKEPGKGTGLGLATVYGVVKQTGGFIWVESAPGLGSKFEIYLPRVHEKLECNVVTQSSPNRKAALHTVLLAEDEAEVRALAYEFLTSAGYRVLVAEDGVRAMQIAKQDKTIDILVTDVVMPRMRGPELAKRMKRMKPGLKVVYVSGYLEPSEIDGDFLKEGFLLDKPFSRDALVNQIGEALSVREPMEVSV